MGYENIVFPEGTKFLITGSAGFIGSNLVEALLNLGYQVRGVDNFSTGHRKNIKEFIHNSNYEFIEGDIRDFEFCLHCCEDINYVSHQASWGSVPRSIEMPIHYENVNVIGTLNMFEASRKMGITRMVYASSSSVYGDSADLPKREGNEGNVLSPYALTKKSNEEYGKLYSNIYGLDTVGLRYFNVFGRRQDPNGAYAAVIPKFVKMLLNNKVPIIHGDGQQSRDFTYIDNVIEGNLKAMFTKEKVSGEVFNIAYGGQEKLIDIYNKICEIMEKEIKPTYSSSRVGDVKHSNADISKAKLLLGYKPDYDYEKGMQIAIDWYRRNL